MISDRLMAFSLQTQAPSFEKLRHAISLAISLVFWGWVLALYQMPLWGWGLLLMSLIHLCKSGRSAIPLSIAWINLVIWGAAWRYATPVGFIWRNGQYWAFSLIFLWVMATVTVLAIARIPTLYPCRSSSRLMHLCPAILIAGGLGLGLVLYHHGLSPR